MDRTDAGPLAPSLSKLPGPLGTRTRLVARALTPPLEIGRLERSRTAVANLGGHPRLSNADRRFSYSSRPAQFWIERIDGARHRRRTLTKSRGITPRRDHVTSRDVVTPLERAGEAVFVERRSVTCRRIDDAH